MYIGSLIETTNEYALAEFAINEYINGNSSLLEAYAEGDITYLYETVSRAEKDRRLKMLHQEMIKRGKADSIGIAELVPTSNKDVMEQKIKPIEEKDLIDNKSTNKHAMRNDIVDKLSGRDTKFGFSKQGINELINDKATSDVYFNDYKERVHGNHVIGKVDRFISQAKNKPKEVVQSMITSLRNLYKKWLDKQNEAKSNGGDVGFFSNICRVILNAIDKLVHRVQTMTS